MLGADAGQNGGQGINNLQCHNGILSSTINLQASINVNNIHAYQPMAEIGLPTVTMSVFVNGQPGNVMAQNTFNVASSMTNGNQWIFGIQDDGPHPGGQFTLGPCTGNTIPQVQVSFTATPVTNAQGLPNGADGGPPVPAVNGPVTVMNALLPQFVAGGAAAVAPTPIVTSVPATTTTAAALAPATVTSVITVFVTSTVTVPAAAPTNAGGNLIATTSMTAVNPAPTQQAGVTVTHHIPKLNTGGGWCNGGNFATQINVMVGPVTPSVAGSKCAGGMPMAECGLASITGSVTLNGQPVNIVSFTGHGFDANGNQAAAQVSGNTFTFGEGDDQPYYGGTLTVQAPCDYNNAAQAPSAIAGGLAFAFAPNTQAGQVMLTMGDGNTVPANVAVVYGA